MSKGSSQKPSRWFVVTIFAVAVITFGVVAILAAMVLFSRDPARPAYLETSPSASSAAANDPSRADEVRRISESDKIYDNIFINGIDVSGLSKKEAAEKIFSVMDKQLDEKKISFVMDGESYDVSYRELGCSYEIENAVDKAWSFARDGEDSKRRDLISALLDNKIDYEVGFEYAPERLEEAYSAFRGKYEIPPVSQKIARENGKFTITPGKSGLLLDTDKMNAEVRALLDKEAEGQVAIELREFTPPENKYDYNSATQLIGSFKTSFTGGATGRNQNLKTAAAKLNGTVLLPDEVFSTNDAFGEMTAENGYAMGQAYMNGVLVDDIGGGVCQVSSTLYCAVLYAELEVVQRQNHSLKVGYLDWAFDATLATPSIDLKFKNDTDYPVTLESYIDGSQVVVNIYGHEIHDPGRKLVFENEFISSTPPAAAEVIEDPALPAGEKAVIVAEKTGYKYNLYKIVYQNDVFVEKVHINTSTYRARRGKIRVGTGPAAAGQPAEALQTEPPAYTDPPEYADPIEDPVNDPVVSEPAGDAGNNYEQPATDPAPYEEPYVPDENGQ